MVGLTSKRIGSQFIMLVKAFTGKELHVQLQVLYGVTVAGLADIKWLIRRPATYLTSGLDLIGGEHVSVEQELLEEYLPVVLPEVGVAGEGLAVAAGTVHGRLHARHELLAHVRQLGNLVGVRRERCKTSER